MTASSGARPTLAALVRTLVSRERTSLSLVDECLRRIAELDSGPDGLGAVLALNPQARSQAEAADEQLERTGRQRGPLHGIPILIKDVFETEGIPTTFGCAAFKGYVPGQDAVAVRRLRAGRRDRAGQDEHSGSRDVLAFRFVERKHHGQQSISRARARRLQRGVGSGGGGRARSRGPGVRHRRLGPGAGSPSTGSSAYVRPRGWCPRMACRRS